MEFWREPGFIVVLVSLVIFYLRLMQLRGKKRRLERQAAVARMNEANRKRGKIPPPAAKDPNKPPFTVSNWYLVIIAAILMLFGTAIRSDITFLPILETYWWIPTAVGVLIFTFCFKVVV
jgi:hypothetical protein